jgi:hypothetical protein
VTAQILHTAVILVASTTSAKYAPLQNPPLRSGVLRCSTLKELYAQGVRQVDAGIVVKTDCAELLHVVTSVKSELPANGWHTIDGKPVRNDFIEHLDKVTSALEDIGMLVRFWHIPRELNTMADALANCALEGDTFEYEVAVTSWREIYKEDLLGAWVG